MAMWVEIEESPKSEMSLEELQTVLNSLIELNFLVMKNGTINDASNETVEKAVRILDSNIKQLIGGGSV